MSRVYIVQARMTSTRLPGKVLMDLAGAPILKRQLDRLKRCATAEKIVVACTDKASDDAIETLCAREGVRVFRGPEEDVLARYLGAARASGASTVVRITSDCPLICPEICDKVVEALAGFDYASNTLERTYPRGLDVEAFTRAALEQAADEAVAPNEREHVTPFLYKNFSGRFRLASVKERDDHSNLRWTVDVMEDLEAVRRIWSGLELDRTELGYRGLLNYVAAHPEISALNASVEQKKL